MMIPPSDLTRAASPAREAIARISSGAARVARPDPTPGTWDVVPSESSYKEEIKALSMSPDLVRRVHRTRSHTRSTSSDAHPELSRPKRRQTKSQKGIE